MAARSASKDEEDKCSTQYVFFLPKQWSFNTAGEHIWDKANNFYTLIHTEKPQPRFQVHKKFTESFWRLYRAARYSSLRIQIIEYWLEFAVKGTRRVT